MTTPHASHGSLREQGQLGPSQDGSVVLDIGGSVGALIITTTPADAGREIEISPSGEPSARTHVAVRERRGPSGTRHAAIYPSLAAGEYTVWSDHDEAITTITITGGSITNIDWTGAAGGRE